MVKGRKLGMRSNCNTTIKKRNILPIVFIILVFVTNNVIAMWLTYMQITNPQIITKKPVVEVSYSYNYAITSIKPSNLANNTFREKNIIDIIDGEPTQDLQKERNNILKGEGTRTKTKHLSVAEQYLKINTSTHEVSIYKNETKIVYINVTDSFNNFVSANLSIVVHTNVSIPYICKFAFPINLTYQYNSSYALKVIDTGRWSLNLNPYYMMLREPIRHGTYNISIVATKNNYTSTSTSILLHIKTVDTGPPVILDISSPSNMTDVRPTHNHANLTLIAKEDIRLATLVILGGEVGHESYTLLYNLAAIVLPIDDSDLFCNETYIHFKNFTIRGGRGEGPSNVTLALIDMDLNYVVVTFVLIVDTEGPEKVEFTYPEEGTTYTVTTLGENVSFDLAWTAEDYSGIAEYKLYSFGTPYDNDLTLLLTTNRTHAHVTLKAPPYILNAKFCYTFLVEAYDICGNSENALINLYIYISPSATTVSSTQSDDNDHSVNPSEQNWFTQWGVYVLGGGLFAYGTYTFLRYLFKHTIKEQPSRKTKKKGPTAKAKSHVRTWKKKNKRRK